MLTGEKVRKLVNLAIKQKQYFSSRRKEYADESINGQVWIDELRLTDVKKALARHKSNARQTNLKLSDLGVNYAFV